MSITRKVLALPSFEEVVLAFSEWSLVDAVTWAGIGGWLLLLALPLTGIDRRHEASRVNYALYLAAGGVALVAAVPLRFAPDRSAWPGCLAAVLFAAVAAARWSLARSRPALAQKPAPRNKETAR